MTLTKEQLERREAEMNRGAQVIQDKYGAASLRQLLSREFNPEHVDEVIEPSEGARPSPDNKAYRERMQRQVRND